MAYSWRWKCLGRRLQNKTYGRATCVFPEHPSFVFKDHKNSGTFTFLSFSIPLPNSASHKRHIMPRDLNLNLTGNSNYQEAACSLLVVRDSRNGVR
jgi:hypothetical protein